MKNTRIGMFAAILVLLGAYASLAEGALYVSDFTANPANVDPTAHDSFGKATDVNPDSHDPSVPPYGSFFNQNEFQGYWTDADLRTLGMFGATDWTFLIKKETGATGGQWINELYATYAGMKIQITPDGADLTKGSWEVVAPDGFFSQMEADFSHVMIVLKTGNAFATYLYSSEGNGGIPDSGTWNTAAFPNPQDTAIQELSYISIYGSAAGPNTISSIPEPTSVAIWSLIAMGFVSGAGLARGRRPFVTGREMSRQ